MSRATEDQLGALHKRVAETMVSALDQSDRAASLLYKHADDELPAGVIRFLEDCVEVNPSLLSAATKFLKDNNISCDPSEDSDLAELESRLNKKRRSASVTQLPLADD